MRRWLIERYVIGSVLPYVLFAAALLTVALLAQQTGKFAELLAGAQAPLSFAAALFGGLVPNVLAFTLPLATLLGVCVGFSRMVGDSELIAMRAAGLSSIRILAPALLVGACVCAVTFYIGFTVAPDAATALRDELQKLALYKLKSPVEPRMFNTDLPGKVIYVREGDEAHGEWCKVFIYAPDANGSVRLITAKTGRIDTTNDVSELILNDVTETTLPPAGDAEKSKEDGTDRRSGAKASKASYETLRATSERVSQLRVRLDTGQKEILEKMRSRPSELDELNWAELRERTRMGDKIQRRYAEIAFHKRLALCSAPLVFALLGGAFGCAAQRGGRGSGILTGLTAALFYYLITLGCEQMARAGTIPPYSEWLGLAFAAALGICLLLFGQRVNLSRLLTAWKRKPPEISDAAQRSARSGARLRRRLSLSPFGLMDRSVLGSLILAFLAVLTTLIGLVLIFTLFEILRYIAVSGASLALIARYLFFLTPMVAVAVAPVATMVAALLTYAIMARRSEAVAWWAAGRSLYRLSLPGLAFAASVCALVWTVEENVMPASNRVQASLREQIRKEKDVAWAMTAGGRQWLASADGRRIYEYALGSGGVGGATLDHPVIYQFDDNGVVLLTVTRAKSASWEGGGGEGAVALKDATSFDLSGGSGVKAQRDAEARAIQLLERYDDFKQTLNETAYLDSAKLKDAAAALRRRNAAAAANVYATAAARRAADAAAPFVMACLAIPMAFMFGRRGTLTALAAAVVIGLGFWGMQSGFNQLGVNQLAPPLLAAWSPPVVFFALGVYLLARSRT